MADYRLLIAQGKQIVFEHDKGFEDLWHDLLKSDVIQLDGELVDGDDRYMGRVALQREHIIGLFLEKARGHGGH